MQDIQIKQFYKQYADGDYETVWLGKVYGDQQVTKIEYHEPRGTGDSHYVDVYVADKRTRRVFNPDNIEFI